jgi:hypothetical protein
MSRNLDLVLKAFQTGAFMRDVVVPAQIADGMVQELCENLIRYQEEGDKWMVTICKYALLGIGFTADLLSRPESRRTLEQVCFPPTFEASCQGTDDVPECVTPVGYYRDEYGRLCPSNDSNPTFDVPADPCKHQGVERMPMVIPCLTGEPAGAPSNPVKPKRRKRKATGSILRGKKPAKKAVKRKKVK